MNDYVKKNFLVNSEETGRQVVFSQRTGKRYFVETIGDGRMADWGSYNPSTGNVENKKGMGKHSGSVTEEESLITKENGFNDIHYVHNGGPYSIIDKLDSKYPTI